MAKTVRSTDLMLSILALASAFLTSTCLAEVGVTDTQILLGSSNDLTGGAKDVGIGMSSGARSYFERVNASGGINGRKLVYTAKDDAYDPARALTNIKSLIETSKVFAIISSNGTPTTQATMPYVTESKVPSLFAFTGSPILYAQPPVANFFQLRVSYADEVASLVNFAVSDLNVRDIGVFYQDDAFGTVGRSGADKTLAEHGLKIHGTGTYARNSVDIAQAVVDLKKANPKAVYMESVTAPGIAFIRACIASDFKPIFLVVSATDISEIKKAFASESIEVYASEVMPSPYEDILPLQKDFHKDLQAYGDNRIDYYTMEGYLGAKTFVAALKIIGKDLTRAKLISTIEGMKDVDLGGLTVTFGPKRHVGFSKNFIFNVHEGKVKLVR